MIMPDGTVDVWLRVVDYDDESVILRDESSEARFTFQEALPIDDLPDRGELAKFRINYEIFHARGLLLRGFPRLSDPHILNITPISGTLKVGDKITMPARDDRTWWQRRAPLWLGGRDFVPGLTVELVVTAICTSQGSAGVPPVAIPPSA
jgi:hypothetical protein